MRIGLLSANPLRVLGLQTIFASDGGLELVPVLSIMDPELAGFALLMIDSDCREDLFALLTAMRKRYPRLRLVVMGLESEHTFIQRVIGTGAKGYLTHMVKEGEIRMAIDIVLDGSVWAPRKVLAKLLESAEAASLKNTGVEAPKITAREREVLRLLVLGRPNREIAQSLGIDEGTVKAHVGRLMRKMGVENRTALTMQTVERKLIPRPES